MARLPAAVLALAAASAPVLAPASPTSVAAQSTPLMSVALFGKPSATYVLCPSTAKEHDDCLPAGHASGPAALGVIRSAALTRGIRRIVVFVAGYHTNLPAGRRDAQNIAQVLGPEFLVIHADWGSRGEAAAYESDGVQAKLQTPAFAAFVADLHRAVPERELDVFAHSMGTRLAAGAMATVKPAADGKAIVVETVFGAPDLTLKDYQRAILRNPEPFGRVTIYVSKHDKALLLSSIIHLHQRIGQMAIWHRVIANTSVVDASSADPKGVGHGYAIHNAAVIRDIAAIFMDAPVPHPAWTRKSPATVMWTLVPARVPASIASPGRS